MDLLITIIVIIAIILGVSGLCYYIYKKKGYSKKKILAAGTALVVILSGTGVLLFPGAPAHTIYVSPTGSDTTGTGAFLTPYHTIQKAINRSAATDIIYLRGGEYNHFGSPTLGILINRSGTAADPFTIMEYPGEEAVIDGTGFVFAHAYGAMRIGTSAAQYSYIRLSGFTIENISGDGTTANHCGALLLNYDGGGWTGANHHIRVDNLTINNCMYNSIMAWGEHSTYRPHNITIENCTINNTVHTYYLGESVTIFNIKQFTIKNNIFTICKKTMLDIANGSCNGLVFGNTFWNNSDSIRHAIYVDASESSAPSSYVVNVTIRNNRINSAFRGGITLGGEMNGGLNNITVSNNIINFTSAAAAKYGISFEQSSADTLLYDNVSIKYNTINVLNEGYPIFFDGGYRTMMQSIYITNNILQSGGGGDYQIYTSTINSTDTCIYRYNNLYNHSTKPSLDYWREAAHTGHLEGTAVNDSAHFHSRTAGDLYLNSTSHAIDAASSSYTIAYDYDYYPRPYNVLYDIGAYEYYSTASFPNVLRKQGVDYFVWLGINTTACYVKNNITDINEATEYVALYNSSPLGWAKFYGDNTGANWTVHTYDVIKTYMDDGAGTTGIFIAENPAFTYGYVRTVNLVKLGNGYNYTAFTSSTPSTLGALNTTLTLPFGYNVAVWDGYYRGGTYTWEVWISGFGTMDGTDPSVGQWDVINTKIDTNKAWVI